MNELKQGSSDWLEIRKQHVTATDSAVILGLSPWKTPYKLFRQKMDLDPPDEETERMREGTRIEPLARKWCEDYFMKEFQPKVVFKDFMMASLDGISSDAREILEIKCGPKSFEQAQRGEINPIYICQMQHQMYVSNVQLAWYLAFNGKKGVMIPVARDDEFINQMLPKLTEFYECLLKYTPPMMTTKDYHQRSEPEWNNLAESYRNAYLDRKRAEQLEETLKQELISLSGSHSSMGGGIKLSKVVRKGIIDYSKIEAITNLDLEPYRKPSSEYWKIIIENE